MKKVLLTSIFLFLFASTALAADTKIGTIDMQEVIAKSEAGQAALQTLKTKFEKMKSKMEKKKNEVEKLRESIQKQNLVLSQEAKEDKEMEFKRKVRDYQDMFEAYQRKIKGEEESLSRPVIEELVKVIDDFGKKNKYTAIFDSKGSGLLYANEAMDLTQKIIVEFNRKWRTSKKGKK